MATFVDIVTFGNELPNSDAHRQAWDKDMKEAQELRQKLLNFLDGLLLLSNHQQNSPKNDKSVH